MEHCAEKTKVSFINYLHVALSMKYLLFLLIFITALFAVGGSYDPPSLYNYSVSVDYDCHAKNLQVTVTSVEGKDIRYGVIAAKDGFNIRVLKDGFGLANGTTDGTGTASFSLYDDGRYLVRVKKEEYFEKERLIEVRACKIEEESYLCSDGKTMRERVACILKLPDEAIQSVQYLPEECRVLSADSAQKNCVVLYRTLQSCRGSKTTDGEREACLRPKLNMRMTILDDFATCNTKLGTASRLCFSQLRENIYTLAKFRLYNLVYKSYALLEKKRVSEDAVINFTTLINEKKIAFNNAKTIAEKKEVLTEAKQAWEDFKMKITEEPV